MRRLYALVTALAVFAALPARAAATDDKTQAAKVAKKVARAQASGQRAKAEGKALEEFAEDVAKYAVLHARALHDLSARDEGATAQPALAAAIARKRARAKAGDVLAPEIQPLFRRLLAEQLEGPDAADARSALTEGNPGQDPEEAPVVLAINGVYPAGAARTTMPASVLATLPPLPSCLHYRVVGRDLVLVDAVAGLVVDILQDATPPVAAQRP